MLKLGRLLQRIQASLKRTIDNSEVTQSLVSRIGRQAYLQGIKASYQFHGAIHGMPKNVPKARVDNWLDNAEDNANFLVIRFKNLITEKERTQQQAKAWLSTASNVSSLKGVDFEADMIASDLALDWKEWVRLYPRAEHRDHHDALEGKIIPITAKFNLNGQLIYGPRDPSVTNWAEEFANCGHGLRYHKNVTREQLGL